ncbi:MAG: hypothetical protein KDA58_03170 [Planctomycetaceae bacterium]|nr:hypothetical protein [Planctomycetaceae bacterium]
MSTIPESPRDDELPEESTDVESVADADDESAATDTVLMDDVDMSDSVFGDDDEDGDGTDHLPPPVPNVSDGSTRVMSEQALQQFSEGHWRPGESESFESGTDDSAGFDDAAEANPTALTDDDEGILAEEGEPPADAPTVVIKGGRGQGPRTGEDFDSKTEPLTGDALLPPSSTEDAASTSAADQPAAEFVLPPDDRPEPLPLPNFEALPAPNLDLPPTPQGGLPAVPQKLLPGTPPQETAVESTASDSPRSPAEEAAPPDTENASDTDATLPESTAEGVFADDGSGGLSWPQQEMGSALPLPSFEALSPPQLDAPASPVAAASTTEDAADDSPTKADAAEDHLPAPDLAGPSKESLATAGLTAAGMAAGAASAASPATSTKATDSKPLPAGANAKSQGTSSGKSPKSAKSAEDQGGGKSSLAWVLLLSYASAMTLAFLFLLIRSGNPRPHHLESLPDVAPEPVNQLSYVPINATLALGHRMQVGDKRRFGNIEVEVRKVTYEPLQFVHYSGDRSKKKPATDPVLKLWLKFTNVSQDQTIAPLDRTLLLRWVAKAGTSVEFSNQYLFPASKSHDPDAIVATYRMPQTSDWDLVGQQLDCELAPGESCETFVASTDDGSANLQGPIVWRVQFRKGFSASGNGVTTMIEVDFDRSEAQG